ncbi:MAG: MFS transporter [Deltaproteobacteria bacterium]|nr:MFS transporter [Deltaproteobacteria bacterium]
MMSNAAFDRIRFRFNNIFYGWWIALVLSVLSTYGNGIYYYGFGTFVKPIVQELAWSMTVVSGAFSIYRLEAGIAAPIVGYLLDRIGPQKIVFSGGLVMGAGFIYLSYVNTALHFYAAIIMISCGWSACAGAAVCNPLLGKWFVKKRGRVIGIYNAAIGLAGLLVPGVAYLIVHYGWRSTLLIMGPITWLVVLPLSFFLKHSPEQFGLLPDGEPSTPVAYDAQGREKAVETAEVDFSLRASMATSAFWILTVCFFMHQITQATVFVHLIPYLIDLGIDPTSAATVVTLIVLTSSVGRYGFGWLGDRYNKKRLLIILFIVQPIAIFSLIRARLLIDVIPFLLLYSISYGGIMVVKATITGDYYGRKNYGKIFGTIQGFSTFGGIAGPIMGGLMYDIHGSYDMAFISFAIMMGFTAFLISFLKRPIPAS